MTRFKKKTSRSQIISLPQKLIIIALIPVTLYALLSDYALRISNTEASKEEAMIAPTSLLRKEGEKEELVPLLSKYTNKGADQIWNALLRKGQQLMKNNPEKYNDKPLVVMEVGAHSIAQSEEAALHDFVAYVIEPSPTSYTKLISQLESKPSNIKEKIALYNKAAGDAKASDNILLDFAASGSTGDHVGTYDMWKMEKGLDQQQYLPEKKRSKLVQVQSLQLDEIIQNTVKPDYTTETVKIGGIDNDVYFIKIDTQGFEPNVFSGLKESIKNRKVRYIMTEWWPKGINLLKDESNADNLCGHPTSFLKMLYNAGYKLYGTSIQSHPRAPSEARRFVNAHSINNRPFDDASKFCEWLYEIESQFPSDEYHMGYWTDIVAVSPDEDNGELLLDGPFFP